MKVKDGITHILLGVSTYGELDGPNCVLIHVETLDEIERTRKEITRMREAGIEVAKVSLYSCLTWIDLMPPVTEDFARKIIVIGDVILDNHDRYGGMACVPANDEDGIDELIGNISVEIERLNVFNDLFSVTACLKHSDVEIGANVYYTQLEEASTLAELLEKEEYA